MAKTDMVNFDKSPEELFEKTEKDLTANNLTPGSIKVTEETYVTDEIYDFENDPADSLRGEEREVEAPDERGAGDEPAEARVQQSGQRLPCSTSSTSS